jgi:hypothetical protein
MREIASLRVALGEVATRDYLRSELRDLLDDLDEREARGKKHKKAKALSYDDADASVTDAAPGDPSTPLA